MIAALRQVEAPSSKVRVIFSHASETTDKHDDPIAAHEEAVKHAFSELINALTEQIRAIEDLGTLPGWVASYPRGNRTYYNYCEADGRGKTIRKYLPKARLSETRACIERHRQVEALKQKRSVVEQAWLGGRMS